jgi:hypothetical protein
MAVTPFALASPRPNPVIEIIIVYGIKSYLKVQNAYVD